MGALPDWLTPLPDAETMRAIDGWAIEHGVSGLELMERAGAGVAGALERLVADGPVTVACGKGNNGGDGFVAARLLREAGREVRVLSLAAPDEYSGDARVNLDRLPGPEPVWAGEEQWSSPTAAIIDALLGTGFSGEPRGDAAVAIEMINRSAVPVVSVDVPSGVDASSGAIRGPAVFASVTATFHAAKPGLWIRPGKAHAGEVQVIDIGVPRGAPAEGADVGLISSSVFELLPRRGAYSTKFTSGHVLVAGGSRDLSGAPQMAAHASMRAGAGYVTACVPAGLQPVLQGLGPPELMTRGLAEHDGGLAVGAVEAVLAETARGGALALGPGLGRSEEAFAFARELARRAGVALVLDADGLNAHAGRLSDLAGREEPTVLTPHAGELGRLLGLDSDAIDGERLRHVRAAAALAGAVVVLKGDDTLVADAGGRVAVSPGASPALATAGSGDVLTGVIAALLAQGLDAFAAAAAGVSLHASAGRRAAIHQGSAEGVVATDLIAMLPGVRAGESFAGAGR